MRRLTSTARVATCLLISLFVRHERTYDRFHENADRLHRAWLVA